jgi:hypothetical protein
MALGRVADQMVHVTGDLPALVFLSFEVWTIRIDAQTSISDLLLGNMNKTSWSSPAYSMLDSARWILFGVTFLCIGTLLRRPVHGVRLWSCLEMLNSKLVLERLFRSLNPTIC